MLGPLILHALRRHFTIISLPIAIVIGLVGYTLEDLISDKYTPSIASVKEQREERLLTQDEEVSSLKEKKFVPKTIFEKNLSPSLQKADTRAKKYEETK